MVVAGPKMQIIFESFYFVSIVNIFLAFGRDDACDNLYFDSFQRFVIEIELLLEIRGYHVLIEMDVISEHVVVICGVVHFGCQVFDMVLDLVVAFEFCGVLDVVEPFRAYFEKFLALFQFFHLPRLHKRYAALVRMRVLVGYLP